MNNIVGADFKGERKDFDFYPTPHNVTIALMDFLNLDKSLVIWEPADGSSKMSKVFQWFGHSVIKSDIRTGQDYFKTFYKSDAIITNPPFNLAAQFIQKAVNEAPLVAMLLKSQYWHAAKRAELFMLYPPAWVLPLCWRPDFLEDERDTKGSPTMDMLWTVWIKGDIVTKYRPLLKPENI